MVEEKNAPSSRSGAQREGILQEKSSPSPASVSLPYRRDESAFESIRKARDEIRLVARLKETEVAYPASQKNSW